MKLKDNPSLLIKGATGSFGIEFKKLSFKSQKLWINNSKRIDFESLFKNF